MICCMNWPAILLIVGVMLLAGAELSQMWWHYAYKRLKITSVDDIFLGIKPLLWLFLYAMIGYILGLLLVVAGVIWTLINIARIIL